MNELNLQKVISDSLTLISKTSKQRISKIKISYTKQKLGSADTKTDSKAHPCRILESLETTLSRYVKDFLKEMALPCYLKAKHRGHQQEPFFDRWNSYLSTGRHYHAPLYIFIMFQTPKPALTKMPQINITVSHCPTYCILDLDIKTMLRLHIWKTSR